MPDGFDAAVDEVRERMVEVGRRAEARIKARLAKSFPPASKPGEHPHLRTGQLHDGISVSVELEGDGVRMTVASAAPHTTYLEASGRPVISDLTDDLIDEIVREIEAGGNPSEAAPSP